MSLSRKGLGTRLVDILQYKDLLVELWGGGPSIVINLYTIQNMGGGGLGASPHAGRRMCMSHNSNTF